MEYVVETGTELGIIVPPLIYDTITKVDHDTADQVVIAASHGGVYAAYLAAKARVRAVILNDAGVGKDNAGIGGLDYCARLGIAAATVAYWSCRIGDGADMAARGVISHANEIARQLGVEPDMWCMKAATALKQAEPTDAEPRPYQEARQVLNGKPGSRPIVLIDSVSLLAPEDAGRIVVTGSHGQELAGSKDGSIQTAVFAALFNDAGIGADQAGTSRLNGLNSRGIAAATVASASARIGEAQSTYEDGILSFVNDRAREFGAEIGQTAKSFVDKLARLSN